MDGRINSFADQGDPPIGDLLAAAREGSEDAISELLGSVQQYLTIVAGLGVEPDLQAKFGVSDVVQETMFEARQDFEQFHGTTLEQWTAWLRRLLINNLINEKRRYRSTEKRCVSREVAWEQMARLAPTADDTSPSQGAIRNEDTESLHRAIEKLSQHHREVIHLRNFERLTFAEIGQRMGRSEDAARMLWARAFESLANEVG